MRNWQLTEVSSGTSSEPADMRAQQAAERPQKITVNDMRMSFVRSFLLLVKITAAGYTFE